MHRIFSLPKELESFKENSEQLKLTGSIENIIKNIERLEKAIPIYTPPRILSWTFSVFTGLLAVIAFILMEFFSELVWEILQRGIIAIVFALGFIGIVILLTIGLIRYEQEIRLRKFFPQVDYLLLKETLKTLEKCYSLQNVVVKINLNYKAPSVAKIIRRNFKTFSFPILRKIFPYSLKKDFVHKFTFSKWEISMMALEHNLQIIAKQKVEIRLQKDITRSGKKKVIAKSFHKLLLETQVVNSKTNEQKQFRYSSKKEKTKREDIVPVYPLTEKKEIEFLKQLCPSIKK